IRTIEAPCAPPPSPGSCAPWSVAVDPSGKFAYVANEGGFAPTSVSMYTIDATTGVLTSIGTIAAGGRAASIAVHPSGKFAYVTNGGSNDVSMYNIDAATGGLTLIPASPPPPPPAPAALSITPQTADFGSAVVGGSADRSFTVINSGGSTASGTAS